MLLYIQGYRVLHYVKREQPLSLNSEASVPFFDYEAGLYKLHDLTVTHSLFT